MLVDERSRQPTLRRERMAARRDRTAARPDRG
jgi:hypothetical protein